MKILIKILLSAGVMMLLFGCTSSPAPVLVSTPAPSPLAKPSTSPVATPVAPSQLMSPTLTDKSLGGVTGRLVLKSTGEPLGGYAIYLGERLPISPGDQYAITVQQNSSPHVEIDSSGYFGFSDVKPGTYALVLWSPIKSTIIADAKNPDKELEVVITAGQIVDLGTVASDPP